SFDWFVPAETEVLGARVADRPAAFPLAELEQRASASIVDRDVFRRRLRPPEHHHQHLMLGEDVQARTLLAPGPWGLGARKPCGTPLNRCSATSILPLPLLWSILHHPRGLECPKDVRPAGRVFAVSGLERVRATRRIRVP